MLDFPRGLVQPDGVLRFGLDALLLASFAATKIGQKKSFCAELGSGCGATLLGLGLLCPHISGIGFELLATQVKAAKQNAQLCHLANRVSFLHIDLAVLTTYKRFQHSCSFVLANPPYGLSKQGRASPHPLREQALRNDLALDVFCRAAYFLLRHHGRFFCIFKASELSRLCMTLHNAKLGLRYLLPVRSKKNKPITRLLIEAQSDAVADLQMASPLTLD